MLTLLFVLLAWVGGSMLLALLVGGCAKAATAFNSLAVAYAPMPAQAAPSSGLPSPRENSDAPAVARVFT
jgi:hypothetical protein